MDAIYIHIYESCLPASSRLKSSEHCPDAVGRGVAEPHVSTRQQLWIMIRVRKLQVMAVCWGRKRRDLISNLGRLSIQYEERVHLHQQDRSEKVMCTEHMVFRHNLYNKSIVIKRSCTHSTKQYAHRLGLLGIMRCLLQRNQKRIFSRNEYNIEESNNQQPRKKCCGKVNTTSTLQS